MLKVYNDEKAITAVLCLHAEGCSNYGVQPTLHSVDTLYSPAMHGDLVISPTSLFYLQN